MTKEVQETCQRLARAAADSMAWLDNPASAELTGSAAAGLRERIRRDARRAGRMLDAARRKPAVSVFGPSQAGKSFLISVLARPENGALFAAFPGHEMDYIREINPEGYGESTGLVTRFTIDHPVTPEGFPIRLELLRESDIVRCLINTFFMDGDQSEPRPDAAAFSAHFADFSARVGPSDGGVQEDEIWDIKEYVEAEFGSAAYAVALEPFWAEAARLAPMLSPKDRAGLLAPLWGNHDRFTALYSDLADALGSLAHAETVFAGADALLPRENSIIDVKTLMDLNGGSLTADITVRTDAGTERALPRAILCALAAELVLPMREAPHPFFAETDMLDFPGARNRFEQPLEMTLAGTQGLSETFLRGKVAYLFDRYVARQDITGMLLCIAGGNMETLDLPRLVDRWIALTHGQGADNRKAEECSLFFVLTKFDEQLSDSANEAGDRTRFERRIEASLLEKFGKAKDPWVTNWAAGTAFHNCLWLRNPNFFVEALFDYDDAQRESLRPDKSARMAELRAGCLSATSVQRHFEDPGAAWDAALKPNDGGVSYLLDRLGRNCDPQTKYRQLNQQAKTVARSIRAVMAPYHTSDNDEERLDKARDEADKVLDGLEIAIGRGLFADLLRAHMVTAPDIVPRISRLPLDVRIDAAAQPTAPELPAQTGFRRPRRGKASAEQPVPETVSNTSGATMMTRSEYQAKTVIEIWAERIEKAGADSVTLKRFGLTQESAATLGSALIMAAERMNLKDSMLGQIKSVDYAQTLEEQARPVATILAHAINRFVETLGQNQLPLEKRSTAEDATGKPRPVFAPQHRQASALDLPATPVNTGAEFGSDWAYALSDLFEANALGYDPASRSSEANKALGQVIAQLGEIV